MHTAALRRLLPRASLHFTWNSHSPTKLLSVLRNLQPRKFAFSSNKSFGGVMLPFSCFVSRPAGIFLRELMYRAPVARVSVLLKNSTPIVLQSVMPFTGSNPLQCHSKGISTHPVRIVATWLSRPPHLYQINEQLRPSNQ